MCRVYVCKVTGCEYTNPERKIFENHVRIEHPDECWICELCGRNFSGLIVCQVVFDSSDQFHWSIYHFISNDYENKNIL